MSMSRDGLLPKKFAQVHPKFQTPAFATIITGILVGVPSLIMPSSLMTDLTSIGTLFAFVLVCFGVLLLPKLPPTNEKKSRFSLPYINGQWIVPILNILFIVAFWSRLQHALVQWNTEGYQEFLFLVFVAISLFVSVLTFRYQFSLIPVLGALCCLYLLIEIPAISWLWFFVWMGLGLVIYALYGRRNSKLNHQ
jgi:basic amino acid/polyamine antiporter, APA family